MIKTSVIIPVYNTGLYLEECINSVFNQTQKEIEVIAINDGSTDDSLDVLLRLQKIYPELIILTQDNQGLGYTRNVGIKKASGEYIFFLDSDDYILENTLENCYKCASKNKTDIVLFDAFEFEDSIERKPIEPNNCDRHKIIEEREEIFSGLFFMEKYYQRSYNPAACLMYCSAAFIRKNNILFLPRVYFEDNEFHCRVMTLAERVMYIPEMFYQYRCRSNSITGTNFNLERAKDHIEVVSAIANLNGEKSWHIVKRISLNLLRYVASVCYKNNLYDEDSRLFEQIFLTWGKICGSDIENVENLEDIDCIYKICTFFSGSSIGVIKKKIEDKRRQLLIQTLRRLPLDQRGYRIGIFGCGKYTDKVLDFYEKEIGSIAKDIIFLDSHIENAGTKYRGYSVYHISEIGDRKLDYILISSPQYEEEMKDMIQEFYGGKFIMILLYGDLHIEL